MRLTKKMANNGRCYLSGLAEVSNYYPKGYGRIQVGHAVEKLGEYEDLEEQGKLMKLPCKLGDITYWISDEDEDGNKIPTVRESAPVIGISMQEDGFYILCDGDKEYQKVGERWCFLTIEDAEAALKEL